MTTGICPTPFRTNTALHLISYCLQTLHVFCVVRPTLLVPHLRSVQPYVRRGDVNAANTEQAVTGAAGYFVGGSVCRYF